MQASNITIKEQIKEYSKEFGIKSMTSITGRILAAENIPCKIPMGNGLSIITNVKRDLTGVDEDFPISSIIAMRSRQGDRRKALAQEIEIADEQYKIDQRRAEMLEFAKDKEKGRIYVGGMNG